MPRPRAKAPARRRSRNALAPTRRSLLAGLALLALGVGAYVLARETSTFAIRSIEVSGAPPAVAAQVRRVLAPFAGTSLVGLDGGRLEHRVEALPTIVSVGYDRAFPHTLRISVVPERPVAVVRSGQNSWLVSARARVVARIDRRSQPGLPRIWLPASTQLTAGAFLAPDAGGRVAEALALASRFPAHIHSAALVGSSLVFRLRSGLELRLGDPTDLRLKLAVARRALAAMPAGMTYLDVAVPGRPVAGTETTTVQNPQVSGGG